MNARTLGIPAAIAGILIGSLILVPDLFGSLQRSFLYFPLAHEPPPMATALPDAEEVRFTTDDGITLGGWLRAGPRDAPFVVVMNGNAGDRSHRAPLAAALAWRGHGVLLFDYRGYAGNAGTPTEKGLIADARAAVAFAAGRGDVDPQLIAYFGESLGAAVAIQLAAERRPLALVLRSPFTSLEDMARLHYPWLPVGPLLVERYDSIGTIAKVRAPVLVIAGTEDRIVPLEHSRRLFEAAGQPKRLAIIDGADHNDLALLSGVQMIEEIVSFLGSALGGQRSP